MYNRRTQSPIYQPGMRLKVMAIQKNGEGKPNEFCYYSTGIDELNHMIGSISRTGTSEIEDLPSTCQGIYQGSIVLIRGEPGSGKTTLAMQILNSFLGSNNSKDKRVGRIVSLEENGKDMAERVSSAFHFCLNEYIADVDKHGEGTLEYITAQEIHRILQYLVQSNDDTKNRLGKLGEILKKLTKESIDIASLSATNQIGMILRFVAYCAQAPKMAGDICDIFAENRPPIKAVEKLGQCMLVVDSLNGFLNIATEYFSDKQHPRTVLNMFCRLLRETFGTSTTIIFTSEYHYLEGTPNEAISESFLCDIEIVLRPEPVRVPASYEPSIQAPVGYNLNALISASAESIESRPFCRVIKSRSTPNQSRRCAYDIVPEEGIVLYPTYPGDGKLVLFAENQPQLNAWDTFFNYDVPESYPALRTSVFNRMSMQNVFEGQRRLRNMPLKTDMYLSSFDSYWVSWYQNFRLKIDIQNELKRIRSTEKEDIKSKLVSDKTKQAQLINSLMRVLRKCDTNMETPITWKDVSDHMSLSYFGDILASKYGDNTWRGWIENEAKMITQKSVVTEETLNEFASDAEYLDSPILKLLTSIKNNIKQSSFLTELPVEKIKLFGEKKSALIRSLKSASHKIAGMHKGNLEKSQHDSSVDNTYLCVPYDANFGLFVCRRDLLEQAELEQDDIETSLLGIIEREKALFKHALCQMVQDIICDTKLNLFKMNCKRTILCGDDDHREFSWEALVKCSENNQNNSKITRNVNDLIASIIKALDENEDIKPEEANQLKKQLNKIKTNLDNEDNIRICLKELSEIERQCCMLQFVMPKAMGRRNYRFRISSEVTVNKIQGLIDHINIKTNKQLACEINGWLHKAYPIKENRDKDITKLEEALNKPLICSWFKSQLEWLLVKWDDSTKKCVDRPTLADSLEFLCRVYDLLIRLSNMYSDNQIRCNKAMVKAAVKRLTRKDLPKTWEEVIVISRLLNRTVQIDWQTFDSFICAFLEVLWSCGGSSMVVEEDYQIRITPNTRYDNVGDFEAVENVWDAGFVEMLRACHIMHELYWQRIAPRTTVTTHKPKAFYKGVAGSKDWLFARHWYSTLIELLTAKNNEGNLLYPDIPEMRLQIMQIPVSMSAWSEDLCTKNEKWNAIIECTAGFECCEDIDLHKYEREIDSPKPGRVSYDPETRSCRNTNPEICPGCPRPLNFSCWGEWSFGLVAGSENTSLSIDLINNMMSSIKVMQRAFSGACVPTVEEFYDMYGDLPCINIPERNEDTLPKITYNELRSIFFRHAKSRQDIYDYRHCGKIIHSKLERLRKAPGKMESVRIIKICTEVFSEVQKLYSAAIIYDE